MQRLLILWVVLGGGFLAGATALFAGHTPSPTPRPTPHARPAVVHDLPAVPLDEPSPTPSAAPTSGTLIPIAPIAGNENRILWLTPVQQTTLVHLLPPPPAAGSAQEQADQAEVLKEQQARTPEQAALALAEANPDLDVIIKPLGLGLTEKHYPITRDLLKKVANEMDLICRRSCNVNKRDRPYVAQLEVKPVSTDPGFSYPNGPTARSHAIAVVLSALFPNESKDILARADAIAQEQVLAGLAYPSDVAASKTLAEALVQDLIAVDPYERDLEDVKAEVRRRSGD